ncbi:MAG: hypothetical protein ACRCW5_01895, partial [Cetobacterium sp.]|uniref:hypothetical protein n=1 Tax=Cetobacterium sp. TaxID=2071632 RepID=UPI003F2DDE80
WLEIQREMYDGQSREIPRLSDTRWACRYAACHNLLDRLPAVVRVLQEIVDDLAHEHMSYIKSRECWRGKKIVE